MSLLVKKFVSLSYVRTFKLYVTHISWNWTSFDHLIALQIFWGVFPSYAYNIVIIFFQCWNVPSLLDLNIKKCLVVNLIIYLETSSYCCLFTGSLRTECTVQAYSTWCFYLLLESTTHVKKTNSGTSVCVAVGTKKLHQVQVRILRFLCYYWP